MCAKRLGVQLSLALLFFLGTGAVQASIGEVVDVRPGATLTAGGSTHRIKTGMQINSGDIIKTDARGIVQLIFQDDTKMAVGPNARMIVDATMMRGSNRARNFAVKALGGSFRFISGKSDSTVYSIETPNATMGIRGTAFDFWVDGNSRTAIALLDGRVRMCESSGGCAVVRGQCSLATAARGEAITRPAKKKHAAQIISAGFPFIMSQSVLKKQLRSEAGNCGFAVPVRKQNSNVRISVEPTLPPTPVPIPDPPKPPDPEPPEPPDAEPPEPPEPSTGFPGQSGPEGPSAGKGNSVSDGQNGTGTGSGQGASNRSDNGHNGGSNSNKGGSGGSNGGKGKGNGKGAGRAN